MLITTVPLELDILVLFLSKKKKKKRTDPICKVYSSVLHFLFQNIFVDTLTQLLSDLLF